MPSLSGIVAVPLMHEATADGAGTAVEILVGAPDGEIDVPIVQLQRHIAGRVALMRGPIVYSLEGVDNGGHVRDLVLPKDAKLTAEFKKDLLGGVMVIRGEALQVSRDETGKLVTKPVTFQAVPYSTWDNRSPGEMVVWLPETAELAEAAK